VVAASTADVAKTADAVTTVVADTSADADTMTVMAMTAAVMPAEPMQAAQAEFIPTPAEQAADMLAVDVASAAAQPAASTAVEDSTAR